MKKILTVIISLMMLICLSAVNAAADEEIVLGPDENGVTKLQLSDGSYIKFGFADGHDKINMEDGYFGLPGGFPLNCFIGIVTIDAEGNVTGAAPAEYYNGIDKASVITSSETNGVITSINKLEGPSNLLPNDVRVVNLNIQTSKENFGDASFSVTFNATIENRNYKITCNRGVSTFKSNNVDLSFAPNITLDELNGIFGSKESFKRYISNSPYVIDENTYVRVHLNPNNYDGVLRIDCGTRGVDFNELTFVCDNGEVQFSGINVLSGNPSFEKFRIVGSITSMKLPESEKTVGIYSCNNGYETTNPNDIGHISDVVFEGVDYGLYLKNCNAASVTDSTFKNCGTGIYLDTHNSQMYGSSKSIVFDNCNTGIEIVYFHEDAYKLEYSGLEFYNSSTDFADFLVHDNKSYTMNGNYYGVDSSKGKTNANSRIPAVKVAEGVECNLAINPYLKYPDSDLWGVDSGTNLLTRVIFGQTGIKQINVNDLNGSNQVNMEFVSNDVNSAGGMLTFGGSK